MEFPKLFDWRGLLVPLCVELEVGPVVGWRCFRVFGLRVVVWAVLRSK